MKFSYPKFSRARRGSVLVVTMIIVIAMAGMVLALCRSMATESLAAANRAAGFQANQVELGAERYVMKLIADQGAAVLDLPQEDFSAVPVGDGFFWILRPDYGDTNLPLFGLVDESSKLNINAANAQTLVKLPGMTDALSQSIYNWHFSTTNVDTPYYQSLGYRSKGAAFESIEELLLIRDLTPDLLWGDGTAPPMGQASSDMLSTSSNSEVTAADLARGWHDLVTIYSTAPTQNPAGQRMINLQNPDRNRLRQLLRTVDSPARANLLVPQSPVFNLRNFLNALSKNEWTAIIDNVTAYSQGGTNVPSAINVNTAPRQVLACLPSLSSTDIDSLISARQSAGSSGSTSMTWLIGAMPAQRLPALVGQITGQPSRYSADILAVSAGGRAFKRVRIVVDPSNQRVIYRRDLSEDGWPMDKQILSSLRAGQPLQANSVQGQI